ncbi:MAG: hypothetical protein ACSLEZ_12805 [Thiobacillus sp.]
MFRQLCFACFLGLNAASAWAGNATTGAPGIQAPSYKQQSDSHLNADRVRHPKQALDQADDMSDPELLVAAMMMGANPEIWLKAMERAGAANVPKNLVQAMSPDMLADWFFSSIEPQFQQTVLSRMVNPKKPQRELPAMRDARFYIPALATIDPATPTQWLKVSADGRVAQSIPPWFDPKTCFEWMRLPMSVGKKVGDTVTTSVPYSWKPPLRY